MFKQESLYQNDSHFDPYQPVSMGTTLISIKYNEGVLMATDCMTSSGNFISDRAAKKVMELSPEVTQYGSIKVIRCGTAAHSQMVSRFVYNQLCYQTMEFPDYSKLKIETVVQLYKNICYNNRNFLSCAFIITNGDKIYSVSSSGMTREHEDFAVNGSGSTYVVGLIQDQIQRNMTYQMSRDLGIRAVLFAIQNDGSSGGNIRIINVNKNGEAFEELIFNNQLRSLLNK